MNTLEEDLKEFKEDCDKTFSFFENYNKDIFMEYHNDTETRELFMLGISYKEWLIYKALTTKKDSESFNFNKYKREYYLVFES